MANDKKDATTPETKDNLVILDVDKLAQTVAIAVAQAMAASQGNQQAPTYDAAALEAIGQAVAAGIAKTSRRKMTPGEYESLGPRNSYHPKPKAQTPVLKRAIWQNDALVQANTMFDREIELANRITHGGRYFDRLVEVIYADDGENVYIRYPNKTNDQRNKVKDAFRSFQDLLEEVVKVQEREDKERQEHEEQLRADRASRLAAKERHFGDNKNYKAAVDKANS